MHILWAPCARRDPRKYLRETSCAASHAGTRTTPTPRTTGGSTGGDSDGDGTVRPSRSGQPRRAGGTRPRPGTDRRSRPRRERSAGHGSSSSERRPGRRKRETATDVQGDGRGRPSPTTGPTHVNGGRRCDRWVQEATPRRRERETATATGLAERAAARTPGRAGAATRPQVRWTCSGAPRSHTSRGPAPVTGCLSRARLPASDTATPPHVS